MSEELQIENDMLKKQAQQNSIGIETLLCQIDAHKTAVNELMSSNLNLKSNLNLLEKQVKLLNQELLASKEKLSQLGPKE